MKGKHIIRRSFIAGLLVWLPILVTYVIIKFIINLFDGTLSLLPHRFQPQQLFGHDIPGIGFLFTIIVIFLTGLLIANFIGNRLVEGWEKLLAKIPLIRSIYMAVKQVTHAFVQPKGESFRKVLLVEYPRKGLWSIGFQTASQFKGIPLEHEMLAVFIPTTPNPTSGFLILAPKEDTIVLSMTVEEAFKVIISLGVMMPKHDIKPPDMPRRE
ncbi:DUF502 domain-containing protein [Candidiatus Paracoxiella cheracis]|uniref:DUF502 domain-containing protein n=1 Tax=Candidiatus Paracoxiella cheracis TaxID=3405120 RepID=UPI003BF52A47